MALILAHAMPKAVSITRATGRGFSPRAGIRGFDTFAPGGCAVGLAIVPTWVSVPERGFVALILRVAASVTGVRCNPDVSVPERGFVALILLQVAPSSGPSQCEQFQSPSGDSWL